MTTKNIITTGSEGKENPYIEVYQALFNGNTSFKNIQTVEDPASVKNTFVRFWPEVI